MYRKIKKQNGERFARTIRNHHNGIFDIPDVDKIVRHAGREAEKLLPYLTSLMPEWQKEGSTPPSVEDPFQLLAQANYDSFHADTLEKQNSIKRYFEKGELLCTFNSATRFERYHIVHAVRRDADQIDRSDFHGIEKRQDEYGTSVISIQMLKRGGFISIKNRYNHTVQGCDNTFNSNPDNIIDGLSEALKIHFDVDFTASKSPLGDGFVLMGRHIVQYNNETNNIYYGDQVWAENGSVHPIDKGAGDALFDGFIFCNKGKRLIKIDPQLRDSFAEDFNRDYGGNKRLNVRNGNLYLGDNHCLIRAERSQITDLDLPDLKSMSNYCLKNVRELVSFNAPNLETMGKQCLQKSPKLKHFQSLSVQNMKHECLELSDSLITFDAPNLTIMGHGCLRRTRFLEVFNTPLLTKMGGKCLLGKSKTGLPTEFNAPLLTQYPRYLAKFITQKTPIPSLG